MSINDYYTCILCHHNLVHPEMLRSVLRYTNPQHFPPRNEAELEGMLVAEVASRCGDAMCGERWNRSWREVVFEVLRANWAVFGLGVAELSGRREMIVCRWYGFSVMDAMNSCEKAEFEGISVMQCLL